MEISFAASPSCLARLRRAVRSSLREAPGTIPSDVVDDVVLAVSEAATNAILTLTGPDHPVETIAETAPG